MRQLFLCCALLFSLNYLSAQEEKIYYPDGISYESVLDADIDALVALSESVVNDTLRARIYAYLSYRVAPTDSEKELAYLDKSFQLSKKINYLRGQGIVKNNLGAIYSDNGDYQTALNYYLEVFDITEQIKDTSFMLLALRNIAHIYERRNQIEESKSTLNRALEIAEQAADTNPLSLSALYNLLGGLSAEEGQYEASIGHLVKALNYTPSGTPEEINLILNMANNYYELGDYKKMLQVIDQAQQLNEQVASPRFAMMRHDLLGKYHLHITGGLEVAEEHYQLALELARSSSNRSYQASSLTSLIQVNKQQGDYKTAVVHHDSLKQLSEELWQLNNEIEMTKMGDKFKAKEKSAQIEVLLKEQEIQEGKVQRSRMLTGGIAIVTLLMGLGLWVFFRNRMRFYQLNTQLAKQAEQISQQELLNVQRDLKLKVVESNLEGQLLERKRVAQDLHDSLGGLLASLKLQALNLTTAADQATLVEGIDQACVEVRSISHHLNPPAFQEQALIEILESLIANFNAQQKVLVQLDVNETEQLEQFSLEQKIELYRIIQELVYNAFRHAEASMINLSLTFHHDYLSLMVEDDGKGFIPEMTKKGLGLESTSRRAENLQATWHIDSSPGRGTVVQVEIPLMISSVVKEKIT